MRSFSIFSLAATIALSVFSSAAPLGVNGGLVARAEVNVRRNVDDVDFVSRDAAPSIPQILDNLTAELSPIVDKIAALTGTEDVVAALNPILEEVVDIVGAAVEQVDSLVGSPVATLLATVDGVVSISDVAQLLVTVLTLITTILSAALKLVGGDLSQLGAIIGTLNQAVTQLVVALIGLLDGLLSALLPLVSGLAPTLLSLGLTTIGGLLSTLGGLLGIIL